MVDIPFPLSSGGLIGDNRRAQDSAGRLVNCFAQGNLESAPSPVEWKRSAGLRLLSPNNVAENHCRGLLQVGNRFSGPVMFAFFNDAGYITDFLGTNAFFFGVIPGTGPVTIAANNRTPTPNVVVIGNVGQAFEVTYNPPLAPVTYPDPDLLTNVNSVANHNGYFVFTSVEGKIQASDLNTTTINSLSFTTARGELLRGVSFLNDYLAFGKDFFEIYRDVGSAPFPLAFVDRVACGLAGPFAIAGFEAGGPGTVLWVADDDSVVQYQGSAQPLTVSTDPVTRDIRKADKDTLEAYVYTHDSNSFWVLTNPGVWTWEYNLTTKRWNERSSDGRLDWRVSQIARLAPSPGLNNAEAFWMAGDRTTGRLGRIDPDVFTEYGDALQVTVESGIVPTFPAKMGVPRADFNVIRHVGNDQSSDPGVAAPAVDISWSDNGGFTYRTPVSRELGVTQNAAAPRVTVLRTGIAKGEGRRFRLSMSDAVSFTLMGGTMTVQNRGEQ